MEKTKTIFRAFRDNGEVIAVFPQISVSSSSIFCQSYMHTGQHGACSPAVMIKDTRPATPTEYAPLLAELKQKGYHPQIAKNFTLADQRLRLKLAV